MTDDASGGLVGFLRERIADDEWSAKSESAYDRPHAGGCSITADVWPACDCDMQARWLAEVDAKLRILDAYVEMLKVQQGFRETSGETAARLALEFVVRQHASVYAHHADYVEEYAPKPFTWHEDGDE